MKKQEKHEFSRFSLKIIAKMFFFAPSALFAIEKYVFSNKQPWKHQSIEPHFAKQRLPQDIVLS